ncbi:MAG: GNAT family N-acetyltransferase [Acidimicrobiales bacterium]|nr:GNAT family N-acetyltransferase [Acidimicrobiales bacterium]
MFELTETVPDVDEFCDLRIAAGLSAMDRPAAAAALPRSLHAVSVRDGDRLVAMGRVVGDGLHVQVTDIAVHPEFQGRGLSRLVMESVMAYVHSLPASTIVSLFADVDWLYGKFGFAVPRASTGMMLRR